MGNTFYFEWEPAFMEWLQIQLGAVGGTIFGLLSFLGEEIVMVAILVFLYWCYDKEFGIFVGTNLMTALIWNPMIKNVALRRRPYMDHAGVRCLKPVKPEADLLDIRAQGYSFPSGHAMNSTVIYGSLAIYRPKVWLIVLAAAIPVLVGLSRVAVGVHYPTDVLAGWLVGTFSLSFISWLQKTVRKRWVLYLILIGAAVPGFFYCDSADFYTAVGTAAGFFAGNLFEMRYVKFENTRKPLYMVLRLAIGTAIFLGLKKLLELPLPEELLTSSTLPAFWLRAARYAVLLFILVGVYPLLFRVIERRGKAQEAGPEKEAAKAQEV